MPDFKNLYIQISIFLIIGLLGFVFVIYQVFVPHKPFPVDSTFTVSKEESGGQIFANLEKNGYIRNVFWAKVIARLSSRNKFYRGEYDFQKPLSTYQILHEITTRPPTLAVLIPEGFTKQQIADRLAKYVVKFDRIDFLAKAEEGFLFPETYYFYSFSTNDEILTEFNKKFNQNTLETFGRVPTRDEVIIASMLEREARDPEDMKVISGIIQNRLKIDMALQIDATVLYGNGIWKSRVLYKDLKRPNDYNTYLNKGLPPAPISNPGINALRAAMVPAKTKYFYYITGRDGKMYYAVTHAEHIKNINKYLR